MPLWSAFFPEDPYLGFGVDDKAPDLQGWGSRDPVFAHLISTVRPKVIIEVGSWKGASAVNMATLVKHLGLDTNLICVDTWLGSPEHFLKRDHPAYWDSLNVKNGYPRLYEQFLANVIHEGHSDIIVPLPQTSENAAQILTRLKIRADLIYIDAAHEFQSVLTDLTLYGDLLQPDGVIFGDDFQSEPVARAARQYASSQGATLLSTEKKYAILGPRRFDLTWPP
jgi:predicted O-methyltransferase YrrM